MRKCDEEADPSSCWNRALPGEEVFVLLGRDPAAPSAIRFWASQRVLLGRNAAGDTQIVSALRMAERLERAQK